MSPGFVNSSVSSDSLAPLLCLSTVTITVPWYYVKTQHSMSMSNTLMFATITSVNTRSWVRSIFCGLHPKIMSHISSLNPFLHACSELFLKLHNSLGLEDVRAKEV